MAIATEVHRSRVVEKLRRHLLRRGLPRLEMTTIVVATGLAGLAASALLLRLGMTPMAVRYPLAVLLAYAAFLGMLRVWVWFHQRRIEPDFGDLLPGFPSDARGGESCDAGEPAFGEGGGEFGGGGAQRSWEGPAEPAEMNVSSGGGGSSGSSGGGSGGSSDWDFDIDIGDGAILLVPIGLALAAVLAAFYVVYLAPALMAEVVLDVVVVAGLYRRLRKLPPHSWLSTAVRRTWLLAFCLAATLGVCGFLMQYIYSDAVTVGQFLERARSEM